MKTYLVGGAVRDRLMGLAPKDHDYVVVETTSLEMQRLGFLRVGASFEVFIHPKTKDEYVVAKELNKDLERRDLTINSMAMDENAQIIDPFGGQKDLAEKILRHTSVHFGDDPLRVYRLARFKAQWPDFTIHPDTFDLAARLASGKAFKNLHGNRVFNELRLALESRKPSEFFNTLESLGALAPHYGKMVKWDHLDIIPADAALRFSALAMEINYADIDSFCDDLYVPAMWKIKSQTAHKAGQFLLKQNFSASAIVDFFYSIDIFRRPELMDFLESLIPSRFRPFRRYFNTVRPVSVTPGKLTGKQIAVEIKRNRIDLLAKVLAKKPD
jgi:tRNA nucleotidyltransferase (CCA-adding enzyme)